MKSNLLKKGIVIELVILVTCMSSAPSSGMCDRVCENEDSTLNDTKVQSILANGHASLKLEISAGDQMKFADAELIIPQTSLWPKNKPFVMSATIDVEVIHDVPGWKYVGEYRTVVEDNLGHVIFDDESEWHHFEVWKKSDGSSSGIVDVHESDSDSWDLSSASGLGVSMWAQCDINYELFRWENDG